MSTSKRDVDKEMNNALIDAFVHQVSAGSKLGGTFTSIAYTNITKEMS